MANDRTGEQRVEDEAARRAAMAAASERIDRVQPWLQLGGALPPEDYERLRAAGVTHVVDLREDQEVERACNA